MCTAVSFRTKDHYFGRNLDLEYRYRETVTVTPRRFPLHFRRAASQHTHYAMIGMATVERGYPLYYEATNEKGLSIASLNFPGYAHYGEERADKENVSAFELIPFILGQCSTAAQAEKLLERTYLAAIPFSDELPLTPLHFMICDRERAIVAEPVKSGLRLFDNPAGVLTNSPPFDMQMANLSNYMALSPYAPQNAFAPAVRLEPCSRGMGAIGLPGDLSSGSRFVRAAYMRAHSLCGNTEHESVSQFFHILSSVRHVRGSVIVDDKPEITLYSSCCNTDRGIYYYTTYENSRICAVDMHRADLDGSDLINYPLEGKQDVRMQN